MDPTKKDEISSPVDKSPEDKLTDQMKNLSVENGQNGLQNADEKAAKSKKESSPSATSPATTKSTPLTPNKSGTNSKLQTNSDSKANKSNKSSPKGSASPKSTEEEKTTDKTSETSKGKENNQKVDAKKYPNLAFYKNQIKSKPNGVFLEEMHNKWWGDYDELEDNHSYIQWLFPNFYQSDFNINASSLSKEEADNFRTDLDIAKKLVKSYELILDFYGMRLKNHSTGELERTEKYEPRYKDQLLTYFHNHLRIRRILTHLNNVGFRRYAIQLVNFLDKEIYGEIGGYDKGTNGEESFNKEAFQTAPLRKLAMMKYNPPFKVWQLYGDHKQDPEKIKLLEKNCFSKYPDGFVDSIYFSHIRD